MFLKFKTHGPRSRFKQSALKNQAPGSKTLGLFYCKRWQTELIPGIDVSWFFDNKTVHGRWVKSLCLLRYYRAFSAHSHPFMRIGVGGCHSKAGAGEKGYRCDSVYIHVQYIVQYKNYQRISIR
ncbi:hypothetical protein B0H14DRAFT_2654519 [Mycena olivaceomarginata]|nr:hypothetical protein B0H14DRAFT_2654519 [Mycena olivaceomarginata]